MSVIEEGKVLTAFKWGFGGCLMVRLVCKRVAKSGKICSKGPSKGFEGLDI